MTLAEHRQRILACEHVLLYLRAHGPGHELPRGIDLLRAGNDRQIPRTLPTSGFRRAPTGKSSLVCHVTSADRKRNMSLGIAEEHRQPVCGKLLHICIGAKAHLWARGETPRCVVPPILQGPWYVFSTLQAKSKRADIGCLRRARRLQPLQSHGSD